MSPKLGMRLLAIGLLGFISGVLIRQFAPKGAGLSGRIEFAGQRDFASTKSGSNFERLPGLAQTHSKHLSAISVRLQAPESIPEDSQDVVELRATVVLNQGPAQDLEVQWTLPEDVQVFSGDSYFQVTGAEPGKVYPVTLAVVGFNKTDKKIVSLTATTERNGIKLGGSSLISSRPEDSMEFLGQGMANSAMEIDTAPRRGKIIR
ncbi:MAG: hypothetical protein IPK04_19380 [Bdellovibrionales bacterium]|jgi:hypothetical protein|nr:hypothetical protein [Bdellovibrionales bacterium]MBL7669175.1 hypothetical protein [Pseudobdellovibrionaceae bacterium]